MSNVKGGVWTNIEDEVLKSAIAKYGLNQWSRVSSRGARKSAKACQSRWQNRLDPSIKKIEWTQDEDQKLLHLAKLLPCQWRTLSGLMVGRTSSACLERYQFLLDQAEATENDGLGLSGPTGGENLSAEAVRKLRPEVDSYPEIRPAKPDEVDMDEADLEMLSEARARLSNTLGKKAKRKQRERLLEQSRRVAALQKRRELKASGINVKIKTTKKGEMDYNADIPFERAPAPGFFDTQDEEDQNERQRQAFDPKKQQLANKRKGDTEDNDKDHKRQKQDKSGQSISAAALKAAQMQKIREAEQSSKRRSLVLPAPQVGESEMEDIVKMGMTGERAVRGAGNDNDATRGLVGSYSMASATPIRTPRAPQEEDRVANELHNIRALTNTQSALLGGEDAPLTELSGPPGTQGATPTPNPMATPFRQGNGIIATPVGAKPGATPLLTPRDNFNLNRDSEATSRKSLLSKLAALPKAKALEFELELPEETEEGAHSRLSEEDAAVRDAREKQLRDAAELAEFNRQTQVVQKRLPRPAVIDIDAMLKKAHAIEDSIRSTVAVETALLIANDALKFGGTRVSGASRPVQILDEEELQTARWEVALELSSDKARKQKDDFDNAFAQIHGAAKLLGLDGYYEDEIDEHQMIVEVFDNTEDRITEAAARSNEQEKKLAKLHGGYQQRARMLRQKITEASEALEDTRIALVTGLRAQTAEQAAAPARLEKLRDEVALVSRRGREAQEEYRRVKEELNGLEINGS